MERLEKDLIARAPQTWLGSPHILHELDTKQSQKFGVPSLLQVDDGFHKMELGVLYLKKEILARHVDLGNT